MATVILGTGIIGVATAHYLSLSEKPGTIHLVEAADELFSSASGFAGGFLAKDWFSGPMLRLAELSFEEHRNLAAAHDGAKKWGYRTGDAFSYIPTPAAGKLAAEGGNSNWLLEGTSRARAASESDDAAKSKAKKPEWLRRRAGDQLDCISVDTVGQVNPYELCNFLKKQCLDRGVHLHHPATAVSVQADSLGELASIRIKNTISSAETDVPCTRVLITAGCWTPQVFRALFPASKLALPITSLSGHSLIVKSPRWTGDDEEEKGKKPAAAGGAEGRGRSCAIYASDLDGFAPEAFAWADGTIYLAGLNHASTPLPPLASDSKARIEPGLIAQLKETARKLFGDGGAGGVDGGLEFGREALCFRPITPVGTPIISRVPDALLAGAGPKGGAGAMATRPGAAGGVYVVSGHGPWGINLSLGTGKIVAEMLQGRPSSIGDDIGHFDLASVMQEIAIKFGPQKAQRLREKL